MLDLKNIDNDTLLIVNDILKQEILLEISRYNILKSIKVISMNEFIKDYLFDYNTKTVYYVMKKFNVKVDIALIYIKNLYYIDDVNYTDEKLVFLKNLKEELLEKELLTVNHLFKEYIRNKIIVVYGSITQFEKKLLNNFNAKYINNNINQNYQHNIYELKSIEEEVTFVASKIAGLIDNGISLNNIKINNISSDYKTIVRRIFNIFNISIDLQDKNTLFNTSLGCYFIDNLDSNVSDTLDKMKDNFDLRVDSINHLYNSIISICNKYSWCDNYLDIKELLIYELKNVSAINNNFNNKISLIDPEEYTSNDDDYIFLLGFNQGTFPATEKDEDYLNDELKQKIGLESTITKNIVHAEKIIKFIGITKNLIITYPTYTSSQVEISNLNDTLKYNIVKDVERNYNYSNLNNRLTLGKFLDTYIKYGVKNKDVDLLLNTYNKNMYRTYNNQFTGIDLNKLREYKNNRLTLSYSSIDSYFHCAFKFYVSNILKLNIYEENFMNYVGSLFHLVLSEYYNDNFNFEISWNKFLISNYRELNKKELFFLKKLKKELVFIIDVLNNQKSYTGLDKLLLEENISIDKNIDKWKITFVGIIDKILYTEKNGNKLVSVIDYKTGNPSLDLTKSPYGMGMQLPIYLYLISNKWKNAQIIGFYLQKILPSIINRDIKKTYDDQKREYLKLQGYSINKESLLNIFDNTYEDSKLIKSMKITSKGFSNYSKILTEDEIQNLIKIVDNNIDIAINGIVNAEFKVNPKQIGMELVGCDFCKFRDICFKSHKDIVNLKEYKDIDFLGGDKNAKMD